MEHLQGMKHANRERVVFLTPGSVPLYALFIIETI